MISVLVISSDKSPKGQIGDISLRYGFEILHSVTPAVASDILPLHI